MITNEAKKYLVGNVTCAVVKNGVVTLSEERGIKPLVLMLTEDKNALSGAVVADRIIGRAAAYLAIYGKAAEVYGEVMTDEAMSLLEKAGIKAERTVAAEHIINRRGDGICPMEAATAEAKSAEEAYLILKEKVTL